MAASTQSGRLVDSATAVREPPPGVVERIHAVEGSIILGHLLDSGPLSEGLALSVSVARRSRFTALGPSRRAGRPEPPLAGDETATLLGSWSASVRPLRGSAGLWTPPACGRRSLPRR